MLTALVFSAAIPSLVLPDAAMADLIEFDATGRLIPRTQEDARPVSQGLPTYKTHPRAVSAHHRAALDAALRHDVPAPLFLELVAAESRWNPKALSPKGAIGLAQLMPATARELGVSPHNPTQNLEGGARYLAAQYRRFGSWRLALAAYNAGPHRVERYRDVPPFKETRAYVARILSRAKNTRATAAPRGATQVYSLLNPPSEPTKERSILWQN